ncbi:MAG: DNA repair protein RecN [Bacteroidales bacterium]|jgi:DNA repair protein RecN (Recombination protein N)|nr:DNA repair protein RecN [Bacteroidales bacterium]
MLTSLKIENYALIKECDISFVSGFSSITGETGAGKSILLGALGLVLGQRADSQVLLDKDKKCIVEAVFTVEDSLKNIFIENDLEYEKESIFRREITPQGKSRAFINDTPVQLAVMKLFAIRLIDIHSQSSTVDLKEKSFQLSLVDDFIEDKNVVNDYKTLYHKYKSLLKTISELEEQEANFLKDKSYYEFLYQELEKANLKEEEQEELEQEVELISNSEEIKQAISSSLFVIDNENEDNILSSLTNVINMLNKVSSHNEELSNLFSRLNSSYIELKDISNELSSFNDNINFNAEQLENDNNRLDLIYNLEKKHNVQTIKELLDIEQQLKEKLSVNNNITEKIQENNILKDKYIKQLKDLSNVIHNNRVASSKEIEKKVKPLLSEMAMKDSELKIEVEKSSELMENGSDSVMFLFNANKTKDNNLKELSKVVSGGELSRLMLAIKAVIAQRFALPTMVFDEIDTGISGDIASKVADIMQNIGKNHQVIVITHLIQMAAKATNQYKVYKHIVDKQTESNICLLTKEQRIEEIAKMLSNDTITKEAIANAKTLLNL